MGLRAKCLNASRLMADLIANISQKNCPNNVFCWQCHAMQLWLNLVIFVLLWAPQRNQDFHRYPNNAPLPCGGLAVEGPTAHIKSFLLGVPAEWDCNQMFEPSCFCFTVSQCCCWALGHVTQFVVMFDISVTYISLYWEMNVFNMKHEWRIQTKTTQKMNSWFSTLMIFFRNLSNLIRWMRSWYCNALYICHRWMVCTFVQRSKFKLNLYWSQMLCDILVTHYLPCYAYI